MSPIERTSTIRLLAIAGGRDVRRKPIDPRLVRVAEKEILRRKATGIWLGRARVAA